MKISAAMQPTPLLAGCAAVQQREMDIARSREAIALMIDAAQQAARDTGNTNILQHVQRIYVPKGLWPYGDPARMIADAIGAPTAKTVLAEFGILQQTLIGDACARIASGEIDCAIIAGGEAKFRALQANIQQVSAPETMQHATPDEIMLPDADLCLEAEMQAGLMMPVGFYAIMESALRFARAEGVDENRNRLAQRYHRFSEIAAKNPQAWKREVSSAENIRDAIGKNRMLAFPYTKAHNSEWNVDQASALILCSEKLADKLGIPDGRRIYPLASSESNHMLCLSQREQLHRAPGADIALQRALDHAHLKKGDIDYLELYSCFPAAVQIFADALAVDDARDVTVTGGMASAGGPLNNYVLQATCRMADLLRENRKANGLVSCVSGMMNKQAYGLWSTEKPANGFAFLDVSDDVKNISRPLDVLDHYEGDATIAGYTVLYQGEQPSRAIAIVDTLDGKRAVVYSEDLSVMQSMMTKEWCGRCVTIKNRGQSQIFEKI